MPTGYPALNIKQKQEIITRIKERGEKVADLAKEYGVVPKTIYNLLKNKVNEPNIALELARVKREKDALLQVVGQLFFDSQVKNKKK